MSETAVIRRPWTQSELDMRPLIITYELTRACHLACSHCRAEAHPHPHPLELKTSEALSLIDEIAQMRPAVLIFTGGDPLLRNDLEILVRHGVKAGLRLAMGPSVTRRVTKEALANLKAWGISQLSFSLDGASAATHDGFRNVPGTFARTMQAMSWAKELGIPLQINTSATRTTTADLPEIAKIVEHYGAQRWTIFFLIPTGRAATSSMLSPTEHEEIYEYLYQLSKQVPFEVKTTEGPAFRRVLKQQTLAEQAHLEGPAPARRPTLAINDGQGYVFISHIGDISPSGFLPIVAGNIRSNTLTDIYRQHPLFRELRQPSHYHGKCGVCDFNDVCGGSRARAFATTGDPLGSDPGCHYMPPAYTTTADESSLQIAVQKPAETTRTAKETPPSHLPTYGRPESAERIGVLVMAYGSPAGPEQVEEYYTHIRHGHKPPPELLADLQRRYSAIGGASPLLAHTLTQIQGIQKALHQIEPGRFLVTPGMKHATPFIEEGVAQLVESKVQRIVGLVLAPHYSALSVAEYIQRACNANTSEIPLTCIENWHLTPGYLTFLTSQLQTTIQALTMSTDINLEDIEILFTAHSLPARILSMNDPYPQQLRATAEAVAARLQLPRWSVAWQSAGRTTEQWIHPSLLDTLPALTERHVKGVIVCPAGFISDHLEILYDLDIEARQVAERLGLAFARTALPNQHTDIFATLAALVCSHLEIVKNA